MEKLIVYEGKIEKKMILVPEKSDNYKNSLAYKEIARISFKDLSTMIKYFDNFLE